MNVQKSIPSLLLLLDKEVGNTYLDLYSGISGNTFFEENQGQAGFSYPGDILAAGVRAVLRSNSGATIKPVMLLVQRESYPALDHIVPGITNITIEKCWQDAAKAWLSDSSQEQAIFFRDQFDSTDGLQPYASVFFCRKKKRYFHPPCHHCGHLLELCRDDQFLENWGAPHYSISLHRFLYCPACSSNHGSLYAIDASVGNSSAYRSLNQLIRDFGTIIDETSPDLQFPCIGCAEHGNCYGEQQKGGERIKTLSFYPFYMIAIPDFSMTGEDYLALISGCSITELLQDKINRGMAGVKSSSSYWEMMFSQQCYFFAPEHRCHSLEVLFLKLTFFRAVYHKLKSGQLGSPTFSESTPLQSIGVTLDTKTTLPLFWGVAPSFISIDNYLDQLKISEGGFLYRLGMLLFVVLFKNKTVDEAEILTGVKSVLQDSSNDSVGSPQVLERIFQPKDITWSGMIKEGDLNAEGLWERIYKFGLKLLQAEQSTDINEAQDIGPEIDDLVSAIQSRLFSTDRPVSHEQRELNKNKLVLTAIANLKKKWSVEEIEPEPAPKLRPEHEEVPQSNGYKNEEKEYDPEKTILISASSPESGKIEKVSSMEELSTRDLGEETIIQSAINERPLNSNDTQPQSTPVEIAGAGDTLEQTMVLPKEKNKETETVDQKRQNDIELEATVQLGSAAGNNVLQQSPKPALQTQNENRELEKTVRIHADDNSVRDETGSELREKKDFHEEAAIENEEEQDFLTETVVLKSSDFKEKK